MNLFLPSDLKSFVSPAASDPAYDMARAETRNQLVWLHDRIYSEIRARRWDVYFHPEWSFSPAHVSDESPTIERMTLRYTKAELVVHLMQKQFGGAPLRWDECSWLGLGVDAHGVFIEWNIPAAARFDAQNFYNKIMLGAPEKRTLRQILAELGGEGALMLKQKGQDLLRVRCARLVDLNILNNTLEKYLPGAQDWNIALRFLVTDAKLANNSAPDELVYRLAQLYALYQFAVWSPRNNYLERPRDQSASEMAPL
jgi:hypothetical protein